MDGEEKPVYFLSHTLSDTQKRWSTVEKEAFAIHYDLQKLYHFLHNAQFTIKIDHQPLKYLLEAPMQNKKIQLWALGITGYNCQIEYVKGSQNYCADLLSRMPSHLEEEDECNDIEPDIGDNTLEINALNSNHFNPRDLAGCDTKKINNVLEDESGQVRKPVIDGFDMVQEQAKDKDLSEIKVKLAQGSGTSAMFKHYILLDNVLYYVSNPDDEPTLRLYVPEQLRYLVVQQYHEDNGHMGIDKTFDAIRQKYF